MTSTWLATTTRERGFEPLKRHISADVVVIGGGLAGVTTAYLLAQKGKRVVLLERDSALASASAYTTAFITYVVDTSLVELSKMFGRERAAAVWQSGAAAIDRIEEISTSEDIACEFQRCPGYLYALKASELSDLRARAQLGEALGFDVRFHESPELGFATPGYLAFSRQAKFHPLKYLLGVQARAAACGATVFEHTEARSIEENQGVFLVKTPEGSVEAPEVVVATYYPFNNPRELYGRTGTYVTYILEAEIPKGSIPVGIYQDTYNPYHYFRVDEAGPHDRMILGGADHRREVLMDPERNFNALER